MNTSASFKWRIVTVCVSVFSALLLSSCVDPSAVTSFSALAPNASQLHSLTVAYAQAPEELQDLDVLQRVASSPADVQNQAKVRNEQVKQIDALHAVLVNYMASLGALANNGLVQSGTSTTKVTDGLTALAKAKPTLGLSAGMISAVGSICTLLADAATAGYRQEQLASIIEKAEEPFRDLIAAEKQIVNEGVIKELEQVEDKTKALAEVTHALKVNDDADAEHATEPKMGSTGVEGLDRKLQHSGAADIASLYLLQQNMSSSLAVVDLQIQAAKSYVSALDKIEAAHEVLYMNRAALLTKAGAKAAIAQLTPIVKDANSALQSLRSM